ncbi:MAG: reverse transcriptase domain-containing protein [Zetaproteobacteria bacterium]|nr:reverse transcriptase domain-containing protein [Zetaproteobacteria bacterium]
MKIQLTHTFEDVIAIENLLSAWREFRVGKSKRKDVQQFERNLMDHILTLHGHLVNKTYSHGGYHSFIITDPKVRHIHKASVQDRLVHHAIVRKLYPFFDRTFIADSYSCRIGKGTQKARDRFRAMMCKVSQNNTKHCWVLKCDIRKFFASVDHGILLSILRQYIPDKDILWLLTNVISSFSLANNQKGMPLGNLTSQLFSNIYMNQFDQWMKHKLKAKYYIRYADDFVFLSCSKIQLEERLPKVQSFLQEQLQLSLHPNKIHLQNLSSGVDFLGWKLFVDHRILRTVTKRRALRRISENPKNETLQSYLGMLQHGNARKIRGEVFGRYWVGRN